MKVLITLNEDGDLNSQVCAHFGHCTHFLVADVNKGVAEKHFTVANKASHGGGGCQAVGEALQYDIDAVVSGGMGMGAQQKLIDAGVKLFGFSGTAQDAIKYISSADAQGITPCAGHEGECQH